eukprot:6313155-Pyramimonas_sp.AAC.1
MLLLTASPPSLVTLTLYRQCLFAKHVVCTAHGDLGRLPLDDLSQGILHQETVEPDILCSTPVPSAPCTPVPARNHRQHISDMKRVVRRRRDSAPSLEHPPAILQARERARHEFTSTWPTP